MKKLLIAMALSALMLSGCGIFRSHSQWKQAQQESPLEIPPGMDHPSASAALVIPPPANEAPAPAATAMQGATSLHLADDVDAAYRRVGQALERGDLGTVAAQDDASHSFRLEVRPQETTGSSQSFLQKHFNTGNAPAEDAAPEPTQAAGPVASVTIHIVAASEGGSTVSAQGDPQQSVRIINVLRGRLGG
ncbi:MAG TPA: hypothetical protein VFJ04_05370 [Rhodanobacteraceae bacterium]|jgi:uncharacterized lipoprotein|nr:hypothetical protein [Rhodanobacteraceae bacterium]